MDEDLPRFSAALQDAKDPSKYKDFFSSNDESEAKKEADLSASANQRSAIVFDRKYGIIYKVEKDQPGKDPGHWIRDDHPKRGRPSKSESEIPKKKRGRPKKVVEVPLPPKKKSTAPPDDAFFD